MRLLGFGDVACIGLAGLRLLKKKYPEAVFSFLTYGAGREIVEFEPDLQDLITLPAGEWPDNLSDAIHPFTKLAEKVISGAYDLIYNFDTWFMPCFMARMLSDSGVRVKGNITKLPATEIVKKLYNNELDSQYVKYPSTFMDSSFPGMDVWNTKPWWRLEKNPPSYPNFFLNKCCGLDGEIDMRVDVFSDVEIIKEAAGKKIIAVATDSRTKNRVYPFLVELLDMLKKNEYYVWTGFDGSSSVKKTLEKLKASDMIISVASAPQWLAAMVGCPVLMIPGPVPPELLDAEINVEKFLPCQYCIQEKCIANKNYACMKVRPETILLLLDNYFSTF